MRHPGLRTQTPTTVNRDHLGCVRTGYYEGRDLIGSTSTPPFPEEYEGCVVGLVPQLLRIKLVGIKLFPPLVFSLTHDSGLLN